MMLECDSHRRYPQIAMLHESTGELIERRLEHETGEVHTLACSDKSQTQMDILFVINRSCFTRCDFSSSRNR